MTRSQLKSCLAQAIEALLKVDKNIRAIVLFGSAVYAPKLACDLDFLVITERKKPWGRYFDALGDLPVWVDVIVQQEGEKLTGPVAAGVMAFGRLIWGDVNAVREVLNEMAVPTFDEARHRLVEADRLLAIATPEFTGHYRDAFNVLFDAARMAAMAYLNTEESRWGELKRQLPRHFGRRFRRIIDQLHVAYFYHGRLPADIEGSFRRWRRIVERFINDLEAAKQREQE
ncbi:MAG: nucleotidyltransferase domain-containing protein [Armatimonadetes bacterium]|nr:nucleotidyltransferase domain-containing protein [Armatimonadota bacterium]